MTGPSNYLPADQRRAVTVEAVIDLAATKNPGDITTAAIAAHMNMTQGAIFRHFPSKDAIWEAVMDWTASHLLKRVETAADAAASPLDALHAMFMSHVEFIIAHPGVPRMMFGELQRAKPSPAKRAAEALLTRYAKLIALWLKKAIEQGQIRDDTDIKAAVGLFIGMTQGLVMQSMMAGDITLVRAQAPGVFKLFEQGISGGYR